MPSAPNLDDGSRFGPKVMPPSSMHSKFAAPDEILNARKEAARLSERSQRKWMEAAEKGEMKRMEQLLGDGQDINQVCEPSKSSALYVASRTNNLRLAEFLLKKGADPAVMTDDLVSPAWIAISRGFDEMVELLLDPEWNKGLVEYLKTETTETLRMSENCGVQQTHYDLAVTRRYWRCVHHVEKVIGVDPAKTRIPDVMYEPPAGWAMGLAASEPGQRPDMPMHFFYWKAFTKEKTQVEPPTGSKKMVHAGEGIFKLDSIVP